MKALFKKCDNFICMFNKARLHETQSELKPV